MSMQRSFSPLSIRRLLPGIGAGVVLASLISSGASAQSAVLAPTPTAVQVIGANDTNATTESQALNVPDKLEVIKTKAVTEIAVRLRLLATFGPKLGAAKADCGTDASVGALVAQTVAGETTLRATIAADTDLVTARADFKQIFENYRVYALVGPKVALTLSCDGLSFFTVKLATEAAHLQTAIDKAKTKGGDVTAAQAAHDAALAQSTAIPAAAKTALLTVIALNPDKGDTAVTASNHATRTSADTAMKTQHDAAKTAAQTLRSGFQALPHGTAKQPRPVGSTSRWALTPANTPTTTNA